MKLTGELKQPIIDFATGKPILLFEPVEDFRQAYEELKDYEKLSLEIKPYKGKRSLDANSYLWVLLDKLSDKLQISRREVYLRELVEHGTFEYIPLRKKDIHLAEAVYRVVVDRGAQEVFDLEGRKETLHILQCFKGSSKYDSKEMSRLIKGVMQDCMQVGIPESELLTPNEKAELKQKYGIDLEGGKKLWSIFTDDMEHCMYTGQYGVERHHIFSHTSTERKLCEKYGFIAPLRPDLHPNGVYRGKDAGKIDKDLRKRCKAYYLEHYGTEEQFRQEFFYRS